MTRRLAGSVIGLVVVVLLALLGNVTAGNEIALGLDLQGGVSVTQEPVGDYNSESLDVAVERIRERVDALGVSEPEIIRQGEAVVVNLPGVDNQDEAIRLVQVTGAVLLRPVLSASPIAPGTDLNPQPEVDDTSPETTAAPGPSRSVPRATTPDTTSEPSEGATPDESSETTTPETTVADSPDTDGAPPADAEPVVPDPASEFADVAAQPISGDPNDPTAAVIVQNIDGTEIYQLGPAFATGEVFNSDATADIIQGGWGVRVTLKRGSSGEDLWNIGASQCFSGTGSCPTRRMAIVLDGVVQSAPTVNQPSFSGGVDITGNFKESEAKDLARVLKSGALPVRLEVQAVQTVSPTLGEDSLRATVVAGLIGIALVLLFMILYYRTLAVIVVGGLLVSAGILWNVITFLSATSGLALSLAGAAGIIVSVGITIDSYVVFFEKLKDEVKAGRTLRNSAERGFKSTWRTIVAADTVSLLAAFTLWYLTVGSVRGFAFFLGLATLTDLVVAWFFTRPAMMLVARSSRIGQRGAFGIKTPAGGTS
ncbi:MAG: protein translocase subunit SecD [Actinomycetota bacterium]|nr:protein translocase subunit SecD [Actinomycetota bacterium]MDA2970883.1 protein translocase subunit SecD [Actinomycetota bacterium]MDA3000131.1 protein translocase subunit SecD [Actinomycetota bacterium]